MKWIVIANSNDCRIYQYEKNVKDLELVREITSPENKLKEHDLVADGFGQYQTRGMASGSYEPEFSHLEIYANNFAKEMASLLNCGRLKNLYDSVVLLMPSHMGGMLLKHLNKNVLGFIQTSIKKNLVQLSERELKEYLCKHLKFNNWVH